MRPTKPRRGQAGSSKRLHLAVLIEQDEDGVFIVSVPTLRGCRTYGHTLEEARRNIAEAVSVCRSDKTP